MALLSGSLRESPFYEGRTQESGRAPCDGCRAKNSTVSTQCFSSEASHVSRDSEQGASWGHRTQRSVPVDGQRSIGVLPIQSNRGRGGEKNRDDSRTRNKNTCPTLLLEQTTTRRKRAPDGSSGLALQQTRDDRGRHLTIHRVAQSILGEKTRTTRLWPS